MNFKHVLNVVKGDLWPLLKERGYVRKFLLLPLVVIPLSLLATPLALRLAAADTSSAPAVLAVDEAYPLPADLQRVLSQGLPSAGGFVVLPVADPEVYVAERKAPIGLRYTPDGRIDVIARQTTVGGAGMVKRLGTLLSYYQAQKLATLLPDAAAAAAAAPQVRVVNAATPAEQALGAMAFLIPMVVIIWLLNTVEHTALEISAGDRERGTLETLLLTPVSRESVAFGKVLAAGAVGVAASVAAWLAVVVTGWISRWLPASDAALSSLDMPIGGQILLTPWGTLGFFAVMITLGLLFAAFILWFGLLADSMRDARMRLTALGLVIMFSGLGLQFSDALANERWVYLTPVLNGVVALLEAAKSTLTPTALATTVAVNLALAGLFASLAARALVRGRILPGSPQV
ncbi:ABC transporter permease [Oceanithermus sp.]|uniref:ABC transporter permease n=3 Tax=Oceanithermus sp. TaxID=2268145 RepID=UPI00257B8E8A|nr:ABC transporter permease [Oceanithermus sp.]